MKKKLFHFFPKKNYLKLTMFLNILTMLKIIVKKTLSKMNKFKITCLLYSLIEQEGTKRLKRKNID